MITNHIQEYCFFFFSSTFCYCHFENKKVFTRLSVYSIYFICFVCSLSGQIVMAISLFLDKHQHLQKKKTLVFLIIFVLALTMFINCASVKWATRIQDSFTFGKLIALAILIVIGLIEVGSGKNHFVSNFLCPNISMHILFPVLYTICKVLTRRIC